MAKSVCRAITALVISLVISGAALADPTRDVVKRPGEVVCGVNGALPGFSLLNAVKEWEGLDVDVCRGVAAAVTGKADRVKFVAPTPQQRFRQLASGAIDVLAANSTIARAARPRCPLGRRCLGRLGALDAVRHARGRGAGDHA